MLAWEDGALFWIAILRACLAIGLALALLIQTEVIRPFLLNFMGVFWLASGLMVLRSLLQHRQVHRFAMVAAFVGVTTGLTVLLREQVGADSHRPVLVMIGLAIVTTGFIHSLGGFEGSISLKLRPHSALPLGAAEVAFGILLAAVPLARDGHAIYWIASTWALCAAAVLLSDALKMRAESLQSLSRPGHTSRAGDG